MRSGTAADSWATAARLVRRTGFGATGAAVDAAAALGSTKYLATVLAADPARDRGAVATPPPQFEAIAKLDKGADITARKARNKQLRGQLQELAGWWVRRMVAVDQPFGEKLTFCWHNHFATSATKVRKADWMLAQNQKLRSMGRADFRPLALTMLTDAAMLFWLDGQKNTVGAPNENLSREFMELFALGHGDGYTEQDVREGARALTGWRIKPDGSTVMRPKLHDNDPKTLLGVTGNLDDVGYCDAILARPASPRYLVTRMYGQLVSDHAPTVAAVNAGVAGYGSERSMSGMLSAMLGSAGLHCRDRHESRQPGGVAGRRGTGAAGARAGSGRHRQTAGDVAGTRTAPLLPAECQRLAIRSRLALDGRRRPADDDGRRAGPQG